MRDKRTCWPTLPNPPPQGDLHSAVMSKLKGRGSIEFSSVTWVGVSLALCVCIGGLFSRYKEKVKMRGGIRKTNKKKKNEKKTKKKYKQEEEEVVT